tara:strand:- start:218 stop:1399 length:1182 start_codon:yes stop_codon:yes gene_type:complete
MKLTKKEIARRLSIWNRTSSYEEAAKKIGIDSKTFADFLRRYSDEAPQLDPVERVGMKSQLSYIKKERDAALKRASAAENIRGSLLNLPPPRKAPPRKPAKSSDGSRSVILHLSDIHYGEVVRSSELDGVNSYNLDIADSRIQRTFDIFQDLITKYWNGEPPEHIHLCLGGDMVSGALHEELKRTDALQPLASARTVAQRLSEGVSGLLNAVQVPMSIYSVPGNHGRTTHKPETKGAAMESLDTMVAWFLEDQFRSHDDVQMFYGDSIDCLFDVYGRKFLLTHGDRMGSKGGAGFVGPVATILRGHQKLSMDYADRGIILYRILTGHFHTTSRLPIGYSNGSLMGWNDFARDIRARKEIASQNMLVVHSQHGVINFQEIHPGLPDEGTIYQGT